MKKVLAAALIVVFLITGLAVTLSVFAQTPTGSTPPSATVQKGEHPEHHPLIYKAIRRLEETKKELEKAASDYGGHKAKAIEAINLALDELKAALQYDKK